MRSRGMLVCEFCTSDTSDARVFQWSICFISRHDMFSIAWLPVCSCFDSDCHFAFSPCVWNGPIQWTRWWERQNPDGNVGVIQCCVLKQLNPMETLGLYSVVIYLLSVIWSQARSFVKTCLHCISCRNDVTILVAKAI